VSSIVIAPASTGRLRRSRIAVTIIAHAKRGSLWKDIPLPLILMIVTMKFIAPRRLEIPARCRLKIARSTDPPL
jgi:hypothetical protein